MVSEWIREGVTVPGKNAVAAQKEKGEKSNKIEEKENFNFEESPIYPQEIYTIYGMKGEGKTSLAFTFPGAKAVLSFDRKSILTKQNLFPNSKDIRVYDAIKYLDEDPEKFVESSMKTYKYCLFLLENIAKEKVDWVIVDGLEIFTRIAEMVMRYKHSLSAFQGIPNLNIWKERRLVIRNLHKKCLDASKKGVIYTTYCAKDEIVDEGTLVTKKDVPNWQDIIMEQTDAVIRVFGKQEKEGKRFFAEIVTSKNDKKLKTGKIVDVTGFKHSVFEQTKGE